MSAAGNWSYTAKATVWPWLGRDDWSQVEQFGPPEVFSCDYSAESKRMTDARGRKDGNLYCLRCVADFSGGRRLALVAHVAVRRL